jgi:hypothetical protein
MTAKSLSQDKQVFLYRQRIDVGGITLDDCDTVLSAGAGKIIIHQDIVTVDMPIVDGNVLLEDGQQLLYA